MEKIRIFNSPLEIGLRILYILNNSSSQLDLQRLIYYNYLVVHSSDIPDAPKSLHPQLPNRSCEILINREIISEGIKLLLIKGLISVKYRKNGVIYKNNKNSKSFLKYFETDYSKDLQERAKWISKKFDKMSDKKLNNFITEQLGKWGSEFSVISNTIGDGNKNE